MSAYSTSSTTWASAPSLPFDLEHTPPAHHIWGFSNRQGDGRYEETEEPEEGFCLVEGTWQEEVIAHGWFCPAVYDDRDVHNVHREEYISCGEYFLSQNCTLVNHGHRGLALQYPGTLA